MRGKTTYLFTLLFLLFSGYCLGQTSNTSTAGNWNTGGNWTNGVPDKGYTVSVGHDMTLNTDLTIEADWTVTGTGSITDPAGGSTYSMSIENNGSLDMTGDVTIESSLTVKNFGALTVRGCDTLTVGETTFENQSTITVEACAVLIINGDANFKNSNAITLNGFIHVVGDVVTENSATISGTGSFSSSGTVEIKNSASIFGSTSDCNSTPCSFGGAPLPVELLSFDVSRINNHATLTWSTATETNNDYFTLERSSDGISFTPIGYVDGAINSSRKIDYQYTDYNVPSKTLFYRLKQTDLNNDFDYSRVVKVSPIANEVAIASLYPNPSNGIFNVEIMDPNLETVTLTIFNSLGQVIYQGSNSQIDLSESEAGIYFYRLTSLGVEPQTGSLILTQ